MMQHVLIIGSGLIGASMAVALARAGVSVDLVEAKPRKEQLAAEFDGRTSAIAHVSVQILSALGIWQRIGESCAITDIRVFEQGGRHYVHYDCKDAGNVPFGHIVENRLLRKALFEAVEDEAQIMVHEPCTLLEYQATASHVNARLSNDHTIRVPLMLIADGKFSQTRAMAGIEPSVSEYGQTAMVASIIHSNSHGGMAVEAFYPSGPFAILPMVGNRSNIVWTEPDELAAHYLSLDDATFTEELRKRCGEFYQDVELVGPRYSYPLVLMQAERLIDNRVALIGDAGHGIHPIAGQGVNLGYRDVAVLAELLVEQARLGMDLGEASLLKRYANERKQDVASMAAATDGLNRLFSNRSPLLYMARDMGLGLVEQMGPVKRLFMRRAMGLTGNPPRLMRGQAL